LGQVNRVVTFASGAALVCSLFLAWESGGGDAFDTFLRVQVYLLVIAVVLLTAALVDLFVPWYGSITIASIFAAAGFGAVVFSPLESGFSHVPAGWWVALISSAAAIVVGVLAVVDLVLDRPRATHSIPAEGSWMPLTGNPGPGWYPDPWGLARTRYWSGTSWTAHTLN
jgi:hypothetical protein